MKVLSVTRYDGRVVEFTHDEFRELTILAHALEGMSENQAHFNFQMQNGQEFIQDSDIDFSGVFGAVKSFYEAKFRLNELKSLVSNFENYLIEKVRKP